MLTVHCNDNPLKSPTRRTVLSCFGIIKVVTGHLGSAWHCNTSKSHSLWIFFLWSPIALWVLEKTSHGISVFLPLTGEKPACNPCNLVSDQAAPQTLAGASVRCLFWALRCLQPSSRIAMRSAFSYLASRIHMRCLVAQVSSEVL